MQMGDARTHSDERDENDRDLIREKIPDALWGHFK